MIYHESIVHETKLINLRENICQYSIYFYLLFHYKANGVVLKVQEKDYYKQYKLAFIYLKI